MRPVRASGVLLALVLAACGPAVEPAADQPTGAATPSMPPVQSEVAAAPEPVTRPQEPDAVDLQGAWSVLPPPPLGLQRELRGHTLVAADGGRPLVWGGQGQVENDCGTGPVGAGARLDGDVWSPLPPSPLAPRSEHAAVWTGSEMLIWGGALAAPSSASCFAPPAADDGAGYDPAAERWRLLPPAPLGPRLAPAAVWTGAEMVVSGGRGPGGRSSPWAVAYNLAADAWRALPAPPSELVEAEDGGTTLAAWSGREVLVVTGPYGDGIETPRARGAAAAYDPAVGRWRRLDRAPIDVHRRSVAVGTGDGLFVLDPLAGEAALLRTDGTWEQVVDGPLPSNEGGGALAAGGGQAAAWTGTAVLLYGGNRPPDSGVCDDSIPCGIPGPGPDLVAYDPADGTWTVAPDAPTGRVQLGAAAWTGERLVIVGGLAASLGAEGREPTRPGATLAFTPG